MKQIPLLYVFVLLTHSKVVLILSGSTMAPRRMGGAVCA